LRLRKTEKVEKIRSCFFPPGISEKEVSNEVQFILIANHGRNGCAQGENPVQGEKEVKLG
jgi:hypothetical protein